MDFGFLLRGFVIGFSIAAPVGPIGVLCIRRTLADGRSTGLACGLGAATADAVYGCIAGFGLSVLSSALIAQQRWLGLIGGTFLCYLGARTFTAAPAGGAAEARGLGLWGAYGTTFLLTLTNPMTILSFAAVFAGLGLGAASGSYAAAAALVLGVFLGSALWWLVLSGLAASLRSRLDLHGLRWVNRGSGVVIAAFGLLALWRGLTARGR
jgi:threonine/homoserine/homoserine lactone efflux protein